MIPLFLVIHIFVGATLAGAGVIAALSLGYGTLVPLLVSAAIGFLLSIPVSWIVAKRIVEATK